MIKLLVSLLVVIVIVLAVAGVLLFNKSIELLDESSKYPLIIINTTSGSVDVGLKVYYWFFSVICVLVAGFLFLLVGVFIAVIVRVLMGE